MTVRALYFFVLGFSGLFAMQGCYGCPKDCYGKDCYDRDKDCRIQDCGCYKDCYDKDCVPDPTTTSDPFPFD